MVSDRKLKLMRKQWVGLLVSLAVQSLWTYDVAADAGSAVQITTAAEATAAARAAADVDRRKDSPAVNERSQEGA
ncbi:hypothetical protein [Streptomyces sp. NPDC056683]|uniref:hypothetical protein n=1 Tax=Streptomyces sp. NPDC056683 TaxID=3345910 RepID=UPI00367501EB